MKEVLKGSFGYINSKKKTQLLKSIVLFSIVLIIFFTGIIMKKNPKSYYFTILAMLMVLPAAKMLVSYVILLPFHSVTKNKYEEVVSLINDSNNMYTDLVITSKEKVMNLAFLIIIDKYVIGLIGREKENLAYIQNYLSTNVECRGFSHTVEIFNDEQKFKEKLSSYQHIEDSIANIEVIDDEKEIKAFLESIMV